MTPSQRRAKARVLARRLDLLAAKVRQLSDEEDVATRVPDGLESLEALHALAPSVSQVREMFADLKASHADVAKAHYSHVEIASVLGVSKPYVQQMVYRGRAQA